MNGAMFPGFNQHIFFSFLIGGSTTSHFCIPDPKGNDTILDSCTFFWFGLEKKRAPSGSLGGGKAPNSWGTKNSNSLYSKYSRILGY